MEDNIPTAPPLDYRNTTSAPSSRERVVETDTSPPKKKRGCLGCFLWLLLIAFILALLAGGGYFLMWKGVISQRTILKTVGRAPAEVSLVNYSDVNVNFDVLKLEGEGDLSSILDSSLTLAPYDVQSFGGLAPGRYRVEIGRASEPPKEGTCDIDVKTGDGYVFYATNEDLLVVERDFDATGPADLRIETSPLCLN